MSGAATTNGSFTATYHDTPDRTLTRANIALRRRMQNGVGIWEAEIAGHVVAAPGGPVSVPDEIARVLVAPLGGRPIGEIARLRSADDGVALLEGHHRLRSYGDEQEALHDSLAEPAAPKRRDPAVEHVRAYLARQLAEVERTDPILRVTNDAEAVHDLRVAVRRTRAVLRTARELLDEKWANRLRDELRWLAGELGRARDLDVLIAGLRADADELGADAAPIVKRLKRERRTARRRVGATLETPRYASLLEDLRSAVDHPPVREGDVAFDRLAARSFDSLEREIRRFRATGTDDALHRVRIKAKRARYAAELAEPVAGKRATKFIKAAKRFQDVVGAHQDAVVAEQRIRAFAESADAAFGAGRLVERQHVRRAAARAGLPRTWRRLRRRGRKAWR